MSKYMKNFISLVGLIIVGSFLAFVYSCIDGLASFSARLNPAFEPWVFWVLFLAVAGMLLWMAAVAFMRPRPMMVYADPSEEDLVRFRQELVVRLRRNRHLRDAEVVINGAGDLGAGLAVLNDLADEEIRATAKRVFIGTAISQNGRLDTLVVLFLITRLTWRVARIYNQRPHYRELINLYANIAATSFLAGSIEEFGIEEYVRELMGPLVGGSAIGAVPGAQAIAGTITASVLTGSTNCLLALRCGIVARDYVSLNLDAKGRMRRSATVEASRMFVSMSAETVTYVTRALVRGTAGAVKSGSAQAVRGVGRTVSGTAGAVGNGARKVGQGVKESARSVSRGAGRGVGAVRDAAGKAASGAVAAGRRVSTVPGAVAGKAAAAVSRVDRLVESGKGTARDVLDRLRQLGKREK